ncbi:MAG: sulfatase [Phycisphaerae bacterium]|nr:sulfatase [Phycisphaerae bacterium]
MERPVNRRGFLKGTVAGVASLAGASLLGPLAETLAAGQADDKDRPNVLMIAVDDLRPQLGCYGHEQMISPHIDALAGRGVLFKRAYCQVPVCGASRASLLTGLRPTNRRFVTYKTWARKDAPDAVSLPGWFRRQGYETISRGKIFHHKTDCKDAWSTLDRLRGFPGYVMAESRQIGRAYRKKHGNSHKQGPATECADRPASDYPDGKVAERCMTDLKRLAKADKPFFLAAGFHKPHLPFAAPKKYWDLYDRSKIDLADNPFAPKGAPRQALHNWGELRGYYTGIPANGPLSDVQARELIHGYYACVSFIDAQIGQLLAELKRQGLANNTLVVLWGDHGWNLGEHGLWCKHCNFETSLHSPLIFAGPGVAEGKSTDALVEYVDLYPTLCDLAGLRQPDHLEGLSMAPLAHKPDRPWKQAVFSRYHKGGL